MFSTKRQTHILLHYPRKYLPLQISNATATFNVASCATDVTLRSLTGYSCPSPAFTHRTLMSVSCVHSQDTDARLLRSLSGHGCPSPAFTLRTLMPVSCVHSQDTDARLLRSLTGHWCPSPSFTHRTLMLVSCVHSQNTVARLLRSLTGHWCPSPLVVVPEQFWPCPCSPSPSPARACEPLRLQQLGWAWQLR